MFSIGEGNGGWCLPLPLLAVDLVLMVVYGAIVIVSFSQMLRIHLRNQQLGWTRQKMFHFMIGSSSIGFTIYFISIPIFTCEGWSFWSRGCGFLLMACPQILFLAAFLLLLSFWVDLCHQANDEDDDEYENSYNESLLQKSKMTPDELYRNDRRRCCLFPTIHVGRRQKIVIVVVLLAFIFMIVFAVLIWIGKGKNPIDSSLMATLYLDAFSAVMLLLGGALACYGSLLFSKMSKVRSDMVSAEMWKVASLAGVSLVSFTSSALLALVTNVPLQTMTISHLKHEESITTPILLVLYYLIGYAVPSAFVLWVMRKMPPRQATERLAPAKILTFVRDAPPSEHNPHRWTSATTSTNQDQPRGFVKIND